MPLPLRAFAHRSAVREVPGSLTRPKPEALIEAVRKDGRVSGAERADLERLLLAPPAEGMDASTRNLLMDALAHSPAPTPSEAHGDVGFGSVVVRGPEEPALPGEYVQAPRIHANAADVLDRVDALEQRFAEDPGLRARMRRAPFPQDPSAQLEWAVGYELARDKLSDPLWTTATNDHSAALLSFVRGILEAQKAGLPLEGDVEAQVLRARDAALERMMEPGVLQGLEQLPFPSAFEDQLIWDPEQLPQVKNNSAALPALRLVSGVLARDANNTRREPVLSERRTFEVDGDTRMYGEHPRRRTSPRRLANDRLLSWFLRRTCS